MGQEKEKEEMLLVVVGQPENIAEQEEQEGQEQKEQGQINEEEKEEQEQEEQEKQQQKQKQYNHLPKQQQQQQQRKLQTLINCISPEIYEYISEAEDYYSAINILERLYTKPNSIIYNRHQLASRRQRKDESVYQYMQRLETLSNTCEFKAVSGEIYRQEYLRDSFINGLESTQIRDKLLENSNLTLKQTFKQ